MLFFFFGKCSVIVWLQMTFKGFFFHYSGSGHSMYFFKTHFPSLNEEMNNSNKHKKIKSKSRLTFVISTALMLNKDCLNLYLYAGRKTRCRSPLSLSLSIWYRYNNNLNTMRLTPKKIYQFLVRLCLP
jgi:hypothetical protein